MPIEHISEIATKGRHMDVRLVMEVNKTVSEKETETQLSDIRLVTEASMDMSEKEMETRLSDALKKSAIKESNTQSMLQIMIDACAKQGIQVKAMQHDEFTEYVAEEKRREKRGICSVAMCKASVMDENELVHENECGYCAKHHSEIFH